MQRTTMVGAALLAALLPGWAGAVEVVGKRLEIYGQLHLSADYVDPDQAGEDAEAVISSNSSRFGIKGRYSLDPRLSILYQIEQEVTLDEEADDNFASRDTFLGVSGYLGDLLVGRVDTPFKDLGGEFALFGDTVADYRAILGASAFRADAPDDDDLIVDSGSNLVNRRAPNALLWRFATEAMELRALYSPDGDGEGDDGNDGDDDAADGDGSVYSISALWEQERAAAGVAYEHWEALEGAEVDGWRFGGSYDLDAFTVGGVFETISSDELPGLEREAVALNGSVPLSEASRLLVQWVHAMEVDEVDDSEADMFAIGAEYDILEAASVYAVYSTLQNASAARYRGIDGGHGEELVTGLGGDPEVFSVGGVVRF